MAKKLVALRLDSDLMERAKAVAEWDKTTVTALVTETLLEYVRTREYYRQHLPHSRRFHKGKLRPRAQVSHTAKRRVWARCEGRCQDCGIDKGGWLQRHPSYAGDKVLGTLHVAHIAAQCNYETPADANADENLTLLCPTCHRRRDSNMRETVNYEQRIPSSGDSR